MKITMVPRDLYYHEVAYVRKLEDALKEIAEQCSELALDEDVMYGDRRCYRALANIALAAIAKAAPPGDQKGEQTSVA